jgi:pimeloyl-ACP methyl ester carboxylesterase
VEALRRLLEARRVQAKVWLIAVVVVSLGGAAAYALTSLHPRDPRSTNAAALAEPSDVASTSEPTPSVPTEDDADPSAPPVVDVPTVSVQPLPQPSVVPTAPPSLVVEGPGSCDGVATMMATTRAAREVVAASGRSKADALPELLFNEAPFAGWPFEIAGEISETDAGYRRNLQETPEMVEEHGFVAGYERRWTSGAKRTMDGADVRIDVYEFASASDALAFDEKSAENPNFCTYVKRTFVVPSVPGATGMHSDAECAVCLQVSFVRGARRYVVSHTVAEFKDYEDVARIAGLEASFAR